MWIKNQFGGGQEVIRAYTRGMGWEGWMEITDGWIKTEYGAKRFWPPAGAGGVVNRVWQMATLPITDTFRGGGGGLEPVMYIGQTQAITMSNIRSGNPTFNIGNMPRQGFWGPPTYANIIGPPSFNGWIVVAAAGNQGAYKLNSSGDFPNFSSTGGLPVAGGWSSSVFGNNRVIALMFDSADPDTLSNHVAVSRNGLSWTELTLPVRANWSRIVYANSRFMAVSADYAGLFVTSTSGESWTSGTMPAGNWGGLAGGNGMFITVQYDPNGTSTLYSIWRNGSWVSRNFPTPGRWNNIAFGGGTWVVVEYGGSRSLVSTDGENWQLVNIPESGEWVDLVYSVAEDCFITAPVNSNRIAYLRR